MDGFKETLDNPEDRPSDDDVATTPRASRFTRPAWQQNVLVLVSGAIMFAYAVVEIARDRVSIGIAAGFFAAALSLTGMVMHLRRGRPSPSWKLGGLLTGGSIAWAYLLATALQDLPSEIRAASISALLGLTAASAIMSRSRTASVLSEEGERHAVDP